MQYTKASKSAQGWTKFSYIDFDTNESFMIAQKYIRIPKDADSQGFYNSFAHNAKEFKAKLKYHCDGCGDMIHLQFKIKPEEFAYLRGKINQVEKLTRAKFRIKISEKKFSEALSEITPF